MKRGNLYAIISLCSLGAYILIALIGLSTNSDRIQKLCLLFGIASLSVWLIWGLLSLVGPRPRADGKLRKAVLISFIAIALLVCITGIFVFIGGESRTVTTPPWFEVIATIMRLQTAQQEYFNSFHTYGTMEQLVAARFIDKDVASTLSSKLPVEGYYFEEFIGVSRSWRCVARPTVWGVIHSPGSKMEWRAEYNFMINEDGMVFYNETENGTEFTKNYQEISSFEVPPG